MKETIYDILRSLNIAKNNFTQEEWIDFINELENNVEGCKDPSCSCDGCNVHFKRDDQCECSPIEVCDACLLQEGHWADED